MRAVWIAACCIFSTLLSGTNGNEELERVKRQTVFRFGVMSDPSNLELFLTINDERVVTLTGRNAETANIVGQVTCNFDTNMYLIQIGGVSTVINNPIMACREVNSTFQVTTLTTGQNTFGESGTGTAYYDSNNIVYIDNTAASLINFINSQIGSAPTPVYQVTSIIVERTSGLVLNQDDTMDDPLPGTNDDSIILTSSTSNPSATHLTIGANENVLYSMSTLNIFRGSSLVNQFDDINEFHVSSSTTLSGGAVDILSRHQASRNGAVSGPADLYIGESQLGSGMIAVFVSSSNVSNLIMRRLVEDLLTFQSSNNMGTITGSFAPVDGTTLITVSNTTQSLSFPNARRIQYDGGTVTIRDGFNNVLLQIGTTASPATLGYVTTTVARSFDMSSTPPLNEAVPDSGLQVLFSNNPSPMLFAYSASNSALQVQVDQLLSTIPTSPPTTQTYSVTVNTAGQVTLFSNGVPLQQVSTMGSIEIERTQCIRYDSNVVSVYENCDTSMEVNRVENIQRLRVDNTETRMIDNFMGSSAISFQGPGRFYFSGTDGFYTSQPEVQRLITFAENANLGTTVGIVRTLDGMGGTRASLVNSNNFLFNFSVLNTIIIEVEQDMGIIFNNDRLSLVDAIVVPEEGTVRFNGGFAMIEGVPGEADRNISLSSTAVQIQSFPGSSGFTTMSSTTNIPGGGVLYMGASGTVYTRDQRTPDSLYTRLDAIDAITNTIPQTSLSTFNGRTVQMFGQSADMVISGPGILYSNPGGEAFYTSDTSLNNRIPSTVSTLIPLSTTYSMDTGNVVISTTGGIPITSVSVTSRRVTVPTGSVTTVGSGAISITDSSGNTQVVSINIDGLNTLNGISTTTIIINGSTTTTLPVPGTFYIDQPNQRAIYVTESTIDRQIMRTISNAISTFVRPSIPAPSPREITSMFSEVDANFGQNVIIPEGSTVRLTCSATNANPPAMFSFFQRQGDSQNFTSLTGASNVMVVSEMTNRATISITGVAVGTEEYRCDASNTAGTQSAFSRVTGTPGRAPEIQNNFFPGISSPGTVAVTARSDMTPTITPIIDESDVDDRTQIANRVLIGCRAKGMATPTIEWSIMTIGINFSDPGVNVSFPGPGQSILSVTLVNNDVTCVIYTCTATNSLGSEMANARVCPQRFDRGAMIRGPCRSCGLSIQEITFEYTQIVEGATNSIAFDDLPNGLVKPQVRLCNERLCPIDNFTFVTSDFGECSEFCERGVQNRTVVCVNGSDVFDNRNCTDRGIPMPRSTATCNTQECPKFTVGEFSACSRTCRGGMMSRTVGCEMIDVDNSNSTNEIVLNVDLDFCLNFSKSEMPAEVAECNSNFMCPVRFAAAFGQCNSFFCQNISYQCVTTDEPVEWPVNDDICTDQGLVRNVPVQSCGGGICDFGDWLASPLNGGNCSEPCGIGVRRFDVSCRSRENMDDILNDRFCNGNKRPASVESCFIENCPGDCTREPFGCETIARFGMCKSFPDLAPQCCRSCPLQARFQ